MPGGRLTFWRRRAVALLGVGAVGAALWVALGDGTSAGDGISGASASELTKAELAGERLITGFGGRHPPEKVVRMIKRGELAGVILFSENLGGRHHARRLIRSL
jgi:hypothetical protein